MVNEKTTEGNLAKQFFNTKCKKDYHGRHFWERRGIIKDDSGEIHSIWQCTQCDMCNAEELKFMTSLEDEDES